MNNNQNDMHRYDDIIGLVHHTSPVHPRMPRAERAAQFSPFAALTGYDGAIKEAGRLTGERLELAGDAREILDGTLRAIRERIAEHPQVTVTYFLPDGRKAGGQYVTVSGRVKRIDGYERVMVLQDGTGIPLDEIREIEAGSQSRHFSDV